MVLSNILLRWYRSFNTLSLDRVQTDRYSAASWNKADEQDFPFITLDLDAKITTVVGANEAGKSHILAAVAKAFRSKTQTHDGRPSKYDKQDICRYSGFDLLETSYWPQFVLEFTAITDADSKIFAKLAGSALIANKLWVRIDGSKQAEFAKIYKSFEDLPARVLSAQEWAAEADVTLPEVRFIAANKALSSQVHVKQLLDMYAEAVPGIAYDPVQLQDIVDQLRLFKLEPGKAVDQAVLTAYGQLFESLEAGRVGPTSSAHLETLLFRDVLGVPKATLDEIKSLASTNLPYIYRIVSDIQSRIDERLDLSRVWQQDPDLRLLVEFEAGFFFFRITDKTGTKYSFDERSSGLQFFLSYYVQALSLEKVSQARGMIVLMDEPDGFLSAAGQRNLLQIFENLVDDRRSRTPTQLIYTTHSPFLINKNFPHRVRLVRKGDGAEGTQIVDRSAYRRFEPIRSALGIDYADTLFVGSENIVVEGPSDQRLLTTGIQVFGRAGPADSFLDLNRVVFVTAGGATRMKSVIQRSLGGTDDKLPVVVALFDGDGAGSSAYQEIFASDLLGKKYLISLDHLGVANSAVTTPKVLEDLIPSSLLAEAASGYLSSRWGKNVDTRDLEARLNSLAEGETLAARLKSIWREIPELQQNGVADDHFRAAVVEELCERLAEGKITSTEAMAQLRSNLLKVCAALSAALDDARAERLRQTSKKRILYFVREFRRSYATKATKANVQRYLELLRNECAGPGPELKQARDNVEALQNDLNTEAGEADASVDRENWVIKLQQFAGRPWG